MEAIASYASNMSRTSLRTVEEWESYLGEQVRNLRIRANLDQIQLAGRADISLGALKNLEGGKGSSLKSLIKVMQALGRSDWLEALAPPIAQHDGWAVGTFTRATCSPEGEYARTS